jgi:hypothetical protein
MAVEVQTPGGSSDTSHDSGAAVIIRDGHLYVLNAEHSNAKTVAVYAPGHWRKAVVTG